MWLNPLTTIDDRAVLSDGTVALVRGRDYHVDRILPHGTAKSSEQLPFDWKRMTDEDQQHLIDSVRSAIERTRAEAEQSGGTIVGNDAVVSFLRNAATPTSRPIGNPPTNLAKVVEPTVNPHTANFYRVRMPVGRSIAGFGQNGLLHLRYRRGTEWHRSARA